MSTACTFGFSAASNALKLIWKLAVSAGMTVRCAPVPFTYGWYSGKYGAKVMISSPGLVTARMACDNAPAAPVVGKMWRPS